jgi:hypothetical protein
MNPVADNPVIVPQRELEEERKPSASEPPRIRCPLCGWSPRKEDRWFCTCGHEWNTFDTGGVCPACLYPWTEICAQFSSGSVTLTWRAPCGI